MPAQCNYKNCTKYASYNFPGEKSRIRCKDHVESGMVISRKDNRICTHPEHKSQDKISRASYNFPDQKRPIFCKIHSEEGMINLNTKNNMCHGCQRKQPSYGFLGGKATHCSKCSIGDMVDLISNLCANENCRKNATYGILGQKAKYCQKHADEGMLDIKNKKCEMCITLGVTSPKQPTYGINKPTHCLEHKTDIMIDMRHSSEKCQDCDKRATYGLERKPTHCTKHKEEGMIDLISNMCNKCGVVQAVFGVQKGEYFCHRCKTEDMKNIRHKMCIGCNEKQPVFAYKGSKAECCSSCKKEGMIDVVNPMCKSCGLFIVPKKPHLCCYCKSTSTIRQKTKEMVVVNYLQEQGYEFIHNKSVGFVCGNYRPDIKIDCGTHLIIVEIDEDQHRQYDQDCETARMYNICQAEGLQCVFLRYNPDIFRDTTKALKVQQHTRLGILTTEIDKYILDPLSDDDISVYRLFYNNPNGEYVQKYDINNRYKELISSIIV